MRDIDKASARELIDSHELNDNFALWLLLAGSRQPRARKVVDDALTKMGYAFHGATWSAAGKAWFLTHNHVVILDETSDTEERTRFVLQLIEDNSDGNRRR